MNIQDEKYHQKSKSISSAEPNYFVHFAMRYSVVKTTFKNKNKMYNKLITSKLPNWPRKAQISDSFSKSPPKDFIRKTLTLGHKILRLEAFRGQ